MHKRAVCSVLGAAWALAVLSPALSADRAPPSGSSAGGVMLSEPPGGIVTETKKPTLNLSDEQRKAVIAEIVERDTHQPTPKEFKPELGATVSHFVNIHSMPPGLVNEIPLLRNYMYAHLDHNIVIVNGMDKKVAALIPLPPNLTQESSSKPDQKLAAQNAVGGLGDLAPEQRQAIYRSASGEAQPVPQTPVLAGAEIPEGMTFQPLPADAANQAPVRDLQYAKLQDGRMLLMDPKSRKVAGIITQDEGMGIAKADGNSAATEGRSGGRQNPGVSGARTADPMREREESGKPSAYSGPSSRGPNNTDR